MSHQIIIISSKLLKTRKAHQCWGCTKEFPTGSMLWCCVSKDGEIIRTYWCETCQNVEYDPEDFIDGIEFGAFAEEVKS